MPSSGKMLKKAVLEKKGKEVGVGRREGGGMGHSVAKQAGRLLGDGNLERSQEARQGLTKPRGGKQGRLLPESLARALVVWPHPVAQIFVGARCVDPGGSRRRMHLNRFLLPDGSFPKRTREGTDRLVISATCVHANRSGSGTGKWLGWHGWMLL